MKITQHYFHFFGFFDNKVFVLFHFAACGPPPKTRQLPLLFPPLNGFPGVYPSASGRAVVCNECFPALRGDKWASYLRWHSYSSATNDYPRCALLFSL